MTSLFHLRCWSGLLAVALLLLTCELARGQDELSIPPPPDPGNGVLGNGAAGIPGPPSAPSRVTRPLSWPGSPAVDAAAERAPIAAPRPVEFPGLPAPPADLSMYRQRLPAPGPNSTAMARAPSSATGFPGAQPPTSAAQPAADPGRQKINYQSLGGAAMAIALPGAGAVEIDGATVVAQVNGEPILAADLLPQVNWLIAKNAKRINPDEVAAARQFLLQQQLESAIILKLLSASAKRKIPPKGIEQFEKKMADVFYSDELPQMMKEYQVETRADLEAQLRAIGSSVEREKKMWTEKVLAHQWMTSQLKEDKEITHIDLLAYYQENVTEFQFPSRARWEQLTVAFGKRFSKSEARQRIAWMGNQVLRGAPFADVARTYSDGVTASQGGQRDWTTRGGLASEVLDEALFNLPVGQLSPILEDKAGFHILRVIERRDAGQTPFVDAQDDIKKVLVKDDKKEEREKYLKDLRSKATVWTIFDRNSSTDRLSAAPQPTPR